MKKHDYEIRLIHVTASDDVRWASIQERDKKFIQTTEKDVREKGDLLPQRINDTYLAYADSIEFYYRDGVNEQANLAATWTRRSKEQNASGTLTITDEASYRKIKNIHNAACAKLKKPELNWENTVENRSI